MSERDLATIHHGDCLATLDGLPAASVDAIVTDPPYGLGFMGKAWDDLPPGREWAEACFRVLKPGGHLLAFGGTRTWHRLAVAVEDAGFEMRDSIAWLYGSGFPKSLDVSKAIDKAAGATREIVGQRSTAASRPITAAWQKCAQDKQSAAFGAGEGMVVDVTAPATPEAEEWQGWGTALKPAFEPIVVARKPLVGTVAANVLTHGTGALNIDACRVSMSDADREAARVPMAKFGTLGADLPAHRVEGRRGDVFEPPSGGRWPANVVLDESQADTLDQQSGTIKGRVGMRQHSGANRIYGAFNPTEMSTGHAGTEDSGGASRFFYIAREDNEPCPNPDPVNTAENPSPPPSASVDSAPSGAATSAHPDTDKQTDSPSTNATPNASRLSGVTGTPATPTIELASSPASQPAEPSQTDSPAKPAANLEQTDTTTTTPSPSISGGSADPATSSTTQTWQALGDTDSARFRYVAKAPKKERPNVDGIAHPTVKPLTLMRWLVRLVTPPGGVVLDPFAGSGTTIEAAILEGFHVIGIEREAEYLPLIQHRIDRRRASDSDEQLDLLATRAER